MHAAVPDQRVTQRRGCVCTCGLACCSAVANSASGWPHCRASQQKRLRHLRKLATLCAAALSLAPHCASGILLLQCASAAPGQTPGSPCAGPPFAVCAPVDVPRRKGACRGDALAALACESTARARRRPAEPSGLVDAAATLPLNMWPTACVASRSGSSARTTVRSRHRRRLWLPRTHMRTGRPSCNVGMQPFANVCGRRNWRRCW